MMCDLCEKVILTDETINYKKLSGNRDELRIVCKKR